MPKVTVSFVGPIGVVPPPAGETYHLAAIPNLRYGKTVGVHGYSCAPHQSLVVIPTVNIDPSAYDNPSMTLKIHPDSGPFDTLKRSPLEDDALDPAEELNVYALQQQAIYFSGGPGDLEVNLPNIPHLGRILGRPARFDRSLLEVSEHVPLPIRPADERLAGVFLIDRGDMTSTSVWGQSPGQPTLYDFKESYDAAPAEQNRDLNMARAFRLAFDSGDNAPELNLEDRKGNTSRTRLRGDEIRIWVVNRELESVLGFGRLAEDVVAEGPEAFERLNTGDSDFLVSYTLLEEKPPGLGSDEPFLAPMPFVRTKEDSVGNDEETKPCGSFCYSG